MLDDSALCGDRRNPQWSELPWLARLGNPLSPARARLIPTRPQIAAKLHEKGFTPLAITNLSHRHPVNPGGAITFITGNLAPGAAQVAGIGYPIPQLAIATVGIIPAPLI